MTRKYNLFVKDILDAIKDIEEFVGNMDFNEFYNDNKTRSAVVLKVDQILEAKKKHTPQSPLYRGEDNADTSAKEGNKEVTPLCKRGDRGDFINTSALEKQIDEMVYKLYGLTDEEIQIVEGRG